MELTETLPVVGTCVLAAIFILLGYLYGRRYEKKNMPKSSSPMNSDPSPIQSKDTRAPINISSKRIKSKKKREIQQEFTHSWIIGTLKGHTSPILDMDLSNNGKFLVSCAEDMATQELGYDYRADTRSSSNDSGVSNTSSTGKGQQLSRRQRKNRIRMQREQQQLASAERRCMTEVEDKSSESESGIGSQDSLKSDEVLNEDETSDSSKESETTDNSACCENKTSTIVSTVYPQMFSHNKCPNYCLVKQYSLQSLDDVVMYKYFHKIMLTEEQLIRGGFPMVYEPEKVVFDNIHMTTIRQKDIYRNKHMVGGKVYFKHWWYKLPTTDVSNQENSDDDDLPGIISDHCYNDFVIKRADSTQRCSKVCIRCNMLFSWDVGQNCRHHPEIRPSRGIRVCVDCGMPSTSPGCLVNNFHVWTGYLPGLNGPCPDYVQTRKSQSPTRKIYSLDCEMCWTIKGLELAQVTLLNLHGDIVYNVHVFPTRDIIDFNTRFSGISAANYKPIRTLTEVQEDLCRFIDEDTILVGHGLENDLRVLKIVHKTVVDTSLLFANDRKRMSLKTLALTRLGRNIQHASHNPIEDAQTALELVLRFIQLKSGLPNPNFKHHSAPFVY